LDRFKNSPFSIDEVKVGIMDLARERIFESNAFNDLLQNLPGRIGTRLTPDAKEHNTPGSIFSRGFCTRYFYVSRFGIFLKNKNPSTLVHKPKIMIE
jgi:hypothetical protein